MRNSDKSYTVKVNDDHTITTSSRYNPMARNHRYTITCTCGARMSTLIANERNTMEGDHIRVARQ